MTPEEFVVSIRAEVLDQNLRAYDEILATPLPDVKDERWRQILGQFVAMTKGQQEAVRLLVRQSMVDTISSVLGILDGTSLLEHYRERFALTYGEEGEKLNGDLQDFFLAEEE